MSALQQIPERLYFRIGDVADILGVKPYVLRYWETEFPFIRPEKSNSGQRVYKRSDVEALVVIKHLLYEERYSIEGARKRARELRKEGLLAQYRAQVMKSAAESVQDGSAQVEDAPMSQDSIQPETVAAAAEAGVNRIVHSSPRNATDPAEEVAGFEISEEQRTRISPEISGQVRALARELQELSSIPIDSLFRL